MRVRAIVAVVAVILSVSACTSTSVPAQTKAVRDSAKITLKHTCDSSICSGTREGEPSPSGSAGMNAWNGTLVIWSHGYRPASPISTNPLDPSEGMTQVDRRQRWRPRRTLRRQLLNDGYALTGSAFASNGWDVQDGVRANEDLYSYFSKTFGTPNRVYIWGASLGGLITQTLAEKHSEWVSGVAPTCGVLGGTNLNLDLALDVAYAVKTLIYPQLELTGFTSADEANAQWDAASQAVAAAAKRADAEIDLGPVRDRRDRRRADPHAGLRRIDRIFAGRGDRAVDHQRARLRHLGSIRHRTAGRGQPLAERRRRLHRADRHHLQGNHRRPAGPDHEVRWRPAPGSTPTLRRGPKPISSATRPARSNDRQSRCTPSTTRSSSFRTRTCSRSVRPPTSSPAASSSCSPARRTSTRARLRTARGIATSRRRSSSARSIWSTNGYGSASTPGPRGVWNALNFTVDNTATAKNTPATIAAGTATTGYDQNYAPSPWPAKSGGS